MIDQNLDAAIEQIRSGNQQGFQILYDKTHNYVYTQARNFLKNESDANDLVQEVYIAAYRSIDSLETNQKIYGWLCGITFRQATKLMRKQKDILLVDEDAAFDTIVDFDEDIQPEAAFDKKTSAQILMDLIDKLPEIQKAVLFAYYYEEMSIKEIANACSCSEGTIKSRLNYARKNLKDLISETEQKDGIKLHSFSLPLLLLTLKMYTDSHAMQLATAQQVYQGCLSHLALQLQDGVIMSATQTVTSNALHVAGKTISTKMATVIATALIGSGMVLGYLGSEIHHNRTNTENVTTEITENTSEISTENITTENISEATTSQITQVTTTELTTQEQTTEVITTEVITTEASTQEQATTNAPATTQTSKKQSSDDDFELDAPEIDIE